MELSNVKSIGARDPAPMAATIAVHEMKALLKDISLRLNREKIGQTTAAFNGSDSLCSLDNSLAEISAKLRGYLADIYSHLNIIVLHKTELREDFSAANQLMTDIDAIQQHIVSIPFDIIEFHTKHSDQMKQVANNEPQVLIRKLAVSGHKEWLQYQVTYITEAIRSVTTLYGLITGKK